MKRLFYTIILFTVMAAYASAEADLSGGYKAPPVNLHKYSVGHTRSAELPSKYDSRDYGLITQSRNQQISGPCWAFATCDAIEAYFNKTGHYDGWLAPQVFTNCHYGHLWTKTDGGNSQIAAAMLSRLQGPVEEDGAPYVASETDCPDYSIDYVPGYSPVTYFLPENDMEAIKECIYEYGAVSAAMRYSSAYYNHDTNTYCYTGTEEPNHGISLIGWDDEEQVFIAKFNYGATAFVNGCMKISYSDSRIMEACSAFPAFIPKSDIDKVYGYDLTGMTRHISFSSAQEVASAFCHFETGSEEEVLEYVGSYTAAPEETITFTILANERLYTKEITCKYSGFHIAKLDEPIVIKGTFTVAVDYPSKTIPCEMKIDDYNEPVFIPTGKQYIQIDNKEYWTYPVGSDAPRYNYFNLCVKAYTRKLEPTNTNEKTSDKTPVVIDGRINPDVWNEAEAIDIYTLDGRLLQHLTQNSLVNSKGLLIFVVRNSNGAVKSSLELLK